MAHGLRRATDYRLPLGIAPFTVVSSRAGSQQFGALVLRPGSGQTSKGLASVTQGPVRTAHR
jgi:hypothetical protein